MGWRVSTLAFAVAVACGDGAAPLPEPGDPFPPDATARAWFRDATADSHVADEIGAPVSRVLGAAVLDVNGDGLLDIISVGGRRPALLLENRGGLAFEDVSAARALFPPDHTYAVATADFDRDGRTDVVLGGNGFLRVLRNHDSGTFEDVTPAGLTFEGSVRGLVVTDLDADGNPDIYAASSVVSIIGSTVGAADRLYMGRGGFAFEDVTSRAAIDDTGWSWTAAAFDADADGDLDLYVANDMLVVDTGERPLPTQPVPYDTAPATDRLLLNEGVSADGVPRFVDSSVASGVAEPRSTMGIVAADLSGDGVTDIYLSDDGRNDLLVGVGDARYRDDTDVHHLGAPARIDTECSAPTLDDEHCWLVTWGTVYEDIDLDGHRDLIAINAALGGHVQPAAAWRGLGAGAFEPVQTDLGWLAGRGVVPADLDGDGDLDLVVAAGDTLRLFENTAGTGTGWLRVALRGTRDTGSGVGARVVAHLSDGRVLDRSIGTGGVVHSWQPLEAHFGLGNATVDAIDVHWPSGDVQTVAVDAADQVVVVRQE